MRTLILSVMLIVMFLYFSTTGLAVDKGLVAYYNFEEGKETKSRIYRATTIMALRRSRGKVWNVGARNAHTIAPDNRVPR